MHGTGGLTMRTNPYKVVSLGANLYGVQYIDHPYIGLPDSWGTKNHAIEYMANLLNLTYDEYRRI